MQKDKNQQKHHYVQQEYLAQWHNPDKHNQLCVFEHDTAKIKPTGANSWRFWDKDFNVLSSSKENYYLPEEVTSEIDSNGILVIRKLNELTREQLSNIDRTTLALYTALQYIRTPRYRKEMDEFFDASIGGFFREDMKAKGGMQMSREEVLSQEPESLEDEKMLKEIEHMTEEEFQSHVPSLKDLDEMKLGLNTEGHSKMIFKAPKHAEEIYDFQWTFFIAPNGTNFITSDNPCFTVSSDPYRPFSGLSSDYSKTIFPLSPSILLYIDNSKKSHSEQFCEASKSIVRGLNQLIVNNSYECVVAKDRTHLESLLKNYTHRKHREGKTKNIGEYYFHTLE